MIALIVSPIVGFLLGYILLRIIRATVKDKELYEPVEEGKNLAKGFDPY